MEQKGGPLERRQPFERQQQRDREILGEFCLGVWGQRAGVHHRLRQPWSDVGLTPRTRRSQGVEADPRRGGRQERAWIRHGIAIGGMPAQIRVLHGVVRLGDRPEHAIGQAAQAAPVWLEAERRIGHQARPTVGTGVPATMTREQTWPWPIAYFTVGYIRAVVIANASVTTALGPHRLTISRR